MNTDDELLVKRAKAYRNILEGETDSTAEATTICWLLLAAFAMDTAQGNPERAAELLMAESAELAGDVRNGRLALAD